MSSSSQGLDGAPAARVHQLFKSGELRAEQIAAHYLGRIAERKALNAFLSVYPEQVLNQARALDRRRDAAPAELGPLAGVPVAVKDCLCTADLPTTCASKVLCRSNGHEAPVPLEHGWRPPYDATVVARLRAADALVLGKCNMDELAMGSSNENSAFGPVLNPWDARRTPGGSSGGSAAAVAAGLAPLALGSDTGGSIRQPAALCGVVGVKPSYGRVSRYGLVAFASSLDQVGPLAPDVRSAARLLGVIAGPDPRDSTCVEKELTDLEVACERVPEGLRVGVPEEYFTTGLDPRVEKVVRRAISALEKAGATLKTVSLPHTKYGVSVYYLLATAEASSNLARFDGVRFGLRVEPPGGDIATMYGATRDAGFGAEVKRRIMLGTYALSAGYYDAYYAKAQSVRTLVRRDFDDAFREVDVIVTPTSPTPAFELGEKTADPLAMYLADVYTLPASLAGIAGLSLPAGMVESPSLPVGVQLLAPAFGEELLFSVGAHLEALLSEFRPPLPATR